MNANEKICYASEAKRTPSLMYRSDEAATRRNMDNFSLDAADVGRRKCNSNGMQEGASTHTHKRCNISEVAEDLDQQGRSHFKTAGESSADTSSCRSSSSFATPSQIEVCPTPENTHRARDFDHNMKMPTNVAILKMLLLSAAMVSFAVGAFAIKMKGELMDLKAEYDSLNEIQCVKSPTYADYSTSSTVNLLPSEIHTFHDEIPKPDLMSLHYATSLISQHLDKDSEDAHDAVKLLYSSLEAYDKKVIDLTGELYNIKSQALADGGNLNIQEQRVNELFMLKEKEIQLTSENHQLRSQLYNSTSFLHLAVHIIKDLKRNNEEIKDENDFVYELVHKNAKEREECTKKYSKLSGERVELEKQLTTEIFDKDAELKMVEIQLGKEVQNLEQQLKVMNEKFDEKETQLVTENHDLRWNLYNTTSFLHFAIYFIRMLQSDYVNVMDENDFVYERIEKMSKERAGFHDKIEKLTEVKTELEQKLLVHEKVKEENNISMMEAEVRHDEVGSAASSTSTSTTESEILLRLEHERRDNKNLQNQLRILRSRLYLATSTIHLGMWYIREMGEFYEDMNEQVDILYELNDEMEDELNRTRECLKVHPNPQWDEVKVEEGNVSE